MLTTDLPPLRQGATLSFCPDLDRSAQFLIKKIEKIDAEKVSITLEYTGGRWAPSDRKKEYTFEVPEEFTIEDIECAWFNIPPLHRLK